MTVLSAPSLKVLCRSLLVLLAVDTHAEAQVASSLNRSFNVTQRNRSLAGGLPRPQDFLRYPRFKARATHRGFQVSTGLINVVSTRSMAEAKAVASQVQEQLTLVAGFADEWTKVHRSPTFGIGGLQVIVDSSGLASHSNTPLLQLAGQESTMVYVNTQPGHPSLAEQMPTALSASTLALFHIAQLDQRLPRWVMEGLASHFARQSTGSEVPVPAIASSYDRRRVSADMAKDVGRDLSAAEAQQRIAFLLSGDDGDHATALIDTLKAESARSGRNAAAFDTLLTERAKLFEDWKKDPSAGSYVLHPKAPWSKLDDKTLKSLLFAVKLANKFSPRQPHIFEPTLYRREGDKFVPETREVAKPKAPSFAQVLKQLTREDFSTMTPDGQLMLRPSYTDLAKYLKPTTRYKMFWDNKGRWVVTYAHSNATNWVVHLHDNPDPNQKRRPVAVLTQLDATKKVTDVKKEESSRLTAATLLR